LLKSSAGKEERRREERSQGRKEYGGWARAGLAGQIRRSGSSGKRRGRPRSVEAAMKNGGAEDGDDGFGGVEARYTLAE